MEVKLLMDRSITQLEKKMNEMTRGFGWNIHGNLQFLNGNYVIIMTKGEFND